MSKGWEGNGLGHSEAKLYGLYSGAKKHKRHDVLKVKLGKTLPEQTAYYLGKGKKKGTSKISWYPENSHQPIIADISNEGIVDRQERRKRFLEINRRSQEKPENILITGLMNTPNAGVGKLHDYSKPKYERYPIDEVIRKNQSNGHHFFDTSSKRFFKSRIPQDAFKKGDTIYFITSEQFEDRIMGITDPRKYTIHEADFNTGIIKSRPIEEEGIFKFQNFDSKSSARTALNKILNE